MTQMNWMKIHSGLNEPKHRVAIGIRIWLFMDMIDSADWETGMIWGWKDEEAAKRLDMPIKTLRTQRKELKEAGYIQCFQGDQCQHIMIMRWRNPRQVNPPQINVPEEDCNDWGCPKMATPHTPKVATPPSRKMATPTIDHKESGKDSANGNGANRQPVERKPNLFINAVAKVFFGIDDYHQIGEDGGRVGKVLSRIRKIEADVTPERIQSFGPWYDRETRDAKTGKSLSRPKDPDKVMEWWGKFNATVPIESEPPKVSEKPVSPLVTQMGISQAELDANPGLQADLERIYREQGKIH